MTLRHGDITDLNPFGAANADAVMSTVVLHHLPDEATVFRSFAEVQRALKPGGGLYWVDFGHHRNEAAIRYFSWQYEDRQLGILTVDYLNSLRAVFEMTTWQEGWSRYLKSFGELYSTFLVPLQGGGERPGAQVAQLTC